MTEAAQAKITPTDEFPRELPLTLHVTDPVVIRELIDREDSAAREIYALTALEIGVAALKHASGMVDGETIRRESDRLFTSVRQLLVENITKLRTEITESLARYFDPTSGDLPRRLEKLVAGDGELASLLRFHVGTEESVLARSLARHVGSESPLFKLLSPRERGSLIDVLTTSIQEALEAQKTAIVQEFSLDHGNSALSRLIEQITDVNGALRRDLAEDLSKISREFSLDNDSGALARLVRRVEQAQRTIAAQFSLDNNDSALSKLTSLLQKTDEGVRANLTLDNESSSLSRLRRELLAIVERVEKESRQFHTELRAQIEGLKIRREQAARSVEHGQNFDDALGELLQMIAQASGDLYEETRSCTGDIPRCKVGDHLITFGSESAAADTAVVFEAKDCHGYSIRNALDEIEVARKNRGAQIGVFVFSRTVAPEGIDMVSRYGQDLIVVWDQNDPTTDLHIRAAVSIARALAVRTVDSKECPVDVDALEKVITAVGKEAAELSRVSTWAQTVRTNGEKICDTVRLIRENLEQRVEELESHLDAIRESLKQEG